MPGGMSAPAGQQGPGLLAALASPALPWCFPLQWEDPHGRQRLWESAERTTRRGDVDGVAILAKVPPPGRHEWFNGLGAAGLSARPGGSTQPWAHCGARTADAPSGAERTAPPVSLLRPHLPCPMARRRSCAAASPLCCRCSSSTAPPSPATAWRQACCQFSELAASVRVCPQGSPC